MDAINRSLEKKSRGYRDWLTEKIRRFNTENGLDMNKSSSNQSGSRIPAANSPNYVQSSFSGPHMATFASKKSFTTKKDSVFRPENVPEIRTLSHHTPEANNVSDTRSWRILDCGSEYHVTNDASRFVEFQESDGFLRTGDYLTVYKGQGTIIIYPKDYYTGKRHHITLSNVLYAPDFQINLISESCLSARGVVHDGINEAVTEKANRRILWKLHLQGGLWGFNPGPSSLHKQQNQRLVLNTRRGPRKTNSNRSSSATIDRWHERLGHIGRDRIQKTADLTEGMEIVQGDMNKKDDSCEVCLKKEANRQISRRPIPPHYGPFGRLFFDIVHMPEYGGKDRYFVHFLVERIRFHIIYTIRSLTETKEVLLIAINFIERWLKIKIYVLFSDNERSIDAETVAHILQMGIQYENSPAYHPEMNRPSERSGGVIITMTRGLLLGANLPMHLWPYAARTAVYLLNRLTTYVNGKAIIPLHEVRRQTAASSLENAPPKVDMSNIRVYGCAAYARIQNLPKIDKLSSRAKLGYLVGYIASNIWQIWFPEEDKVENVRDAVFLENRRYSQPPKANEVPKIPESALIIDMLEAMVIVQEEMNLWGATPTSDPAKTVEDLTAYRARTTAELSNREHREHLQTMNSGVSASKEPQNTPEPQGQLPTPISSPHPPIFPAEKPSPSSNEHPHSTNENQQETDLNEESQEDTTPYEEDQQEISPNDQLQQELNLISTNVDGESTEETTIITPVAPRDINSQIDASNIIDAKRTRRSTYDPSYKSYHAAFISPENEDSRPLRQAYTTAYYAGLNAPEKLHSDDLPPPPKAWKDVANHPYCAMWKTAARVELEGLKAKDTFDVVNRPTDLAQKVLPLIWVFTYKLDANGFLIKAKARICVRGDLQMLNAEEKYSATLAAKTGRLIFALVAGFDLESRQLDAINAFLNSELTEIVYTQLPDGFRQKGQVWKLKRALYGLRTSPRLWQKEASRVLQELGLQPVPEDPCLFVGEGIIVFFYVDDIIIVNIPTDAARRRVEQLCHGIKSYWDVRDLGEARWFLGIRILRDREQKKLWLCQDAYMSSIGVRFHRTEGRFVHTPIPATEILSPSTSQASEAHIHEMQQKIGSIQYPANQTRPDIAIHASKLAQFTSNPSQRHLELADRVISYLYQTRYHALEYGPVERLIGVDPSLSATVVIAGDTSFADNHDNSSSYGYIIKVFGGAVDWKASKQKSVSTSTTEAGFRTVLEVGKMLIWWRRMMHAIGFKLDHPTPIHCDNQQTLRLLTSENPGIDTKLKHVDVARSWIYERIQANELEVKWTPTKHMPADGLTKILPKQGFEESRIKMGVKNVQQIVEAIQSMTD